MVNVGGVSRRGGAEVFGKGGERSQSFKDLEILSWVYLLSFHIKNEVFIILLPS